MALSCSLHGISTDQITHSQSSQSPILGRMHGFFENMWQSGMDASNMPLKWFAGLPQRVAHWPSRYAMYFVCLDSSTEAGSYHFYFSTINICPTVLSFLFVHVCCQARCEQTLASVGGCRTIGGQGMESR